ncbi:MAG: nitroreductase family protein [Planctomycetes bacterium]|nr:nitroreductase family protein [Planctomycetota bacterium]
MLSELIRKNRSYRRFHQDALVARETLEELVGLARLCPSAANRQPLKYLLSCDADRNALIFPRLAWAGYLTNWSGPAKDERPTAYIIILGDTEITHSFGCDHGIAAQSILLGAVERGLGGCMIGSIERDKLRKALDIPKRFEILLVLALGKPSETVVLDDAKSPDDIKYWRDDSDVHHVPKRPLSELIVD